MARPSAKVLGDRRHAPGSRRRHRPVAKSRFGHALQSARGRVFGDLQVVVVNQDRKKRRSTPSSGWRIGRHRHPTATIVTVAVSAEDEDNDGDEVDPWA